MGKYGDLLPKPKTYKEALLQVIPLFTLILEDAEEVLDIIDYVNRQDFPDEGREKDLLCKLRNTAEQIRQTAGLNLLSS